MSTAEETWLAVCASVSRVLQGAPVPTVAPLIAPEDVK